MLAWVGVTMSGLQIDGGYLKVKREWFSVCPKRSRENNPSTICMTTAMAATFIIF